MERRSFLEALALAPFAAKFCAIEKVFDPHRVYFDIGANIRTPALWTPPYFISASGLTIGDFDVPVLVSSDVPKNKVFLVENIFLKACAKKALEEVERALLWGDSGAETIDFGGSALLPLRRY
jgi:hypothetical protein